MHKMIHISVTVCLPMCSHGMLYYVHPEGRVHLQCATQLIIWVLDQKYIYDVASSSDSVAL